MSLYGTIHYQFSVGVAVKMIQPTNFAVVKGTRRVAVTFEEGAINRDAKTRAGLRLGKANVLFRNPPTFHCHNCDAQKVEGEICRPGIIEEVTALLFCR